MCTQKYGKILKKYKNMGKIQKILKNHKKLRKYVQKSKNQYFHDFQYQLLLKTKLLTENNLQVQVSRRDNFGRRGDRGGHHILYFLISQRTQHLRHQNTCVVVFMYGIIIYILVLNNKLISKKHG